jgi:hypothetical protein
MLTELRAGMKRSPVKDPERLSSEDMFEQLKREINVKKNARGVVEIVEKVRRVV